MLTPYKKSSSLAPQRRSQAQNNQQQMTPYSGNSNRKQFNDEPYQRQQMMKYDDHHNENMFENLHNHQMQIFQEFDRATNSMMKHFEESFGMPSFGQMMRPFGGLKDLHQEMNRMMDFSDIHEQISNNRQQQGPFTSISRSYVSHQAIGPNGEKHQEKYFSNNVVHKGQDGNTISERQQGYKNGSTGKDVIAQERMLNEQGRKIIKERNRQGEVFQTNHYRNMDEERVGEFDQRWNQYNEKVGFVQNHAKYLGYNEGPRAIKKNDEDQQYNNTYHNKQPRNENRYDDQRRGDYISSLKKQEHMPVTYQRDSDNYGLRRAIDLQPTQPTGLPYYPVNQPQPIQYQQHHNTVIPVRQPVQNIQQNHNTQSNNGVYRQRQTTNNAIPMAG